VQRPSLLPRSRRFPHGKKAQSACRWPKQELRWVLSERRPALPLLWPGLNANRSDRVPPGLPHYWPMQFQGGHTEIQRYRTHCTTSGIGRVSRVSPVPHGDRYATGTRDEDAMGQAARVWHHRRCSTNRRSTPCRNLLMRASPSPPLEFDSRQSESNCRTFTLYADVPAKINLRALYADVPAKINLRGVHYTASGFVLTHQRRFSLPTPMEIPPRSHPGQMGKWLLKWTVRPWSQRPD
jgi:hypothetical protein